MASRTLPQGAQPGDSRARNCLQFDAMEMRQQFDRAPFLIRHRLIDHPLLQLARLVELSKTLPQESVEYNAGNLPVNQDPALTPRNGLSPEETIRRIETCMSWMVLKNVEQDAEYARLLDECLDEVRPAIEAVSPGMTHRKAFIFVSSPGAVTPFHVDFEYNFLLQIRGDKVMTVFDGQDRSVLSELDRERAVSGAPRNLKYRDEFAAKGRQFHLQPGTGLHVPLSSPHWVRVGSDVSVSFSITFHSSRSDQTIGAHRANSVLRKLGISPREVGRSQVVDALKFFAHRVYRKIQATAVRPGGN